MSNNSLAPGQSLQNNQSITSTNGVYMAIMQDDGNFVVYEKTTPLKPRWASQTANKGGKQVIMQVDGNLVVYNGKGVSTADALWASGTNGHDNSTLIMQDDGNLVIYEPGKPTWASGTNQ